MKLTCTVELPDDTTFTMNESPWRISGRVEISFAWVDFGIGSYEYWGSTGVDSRMGPEDLEITSVEIDFLEYEKFGEWAEFYKPCDTIVAEIVKALDKKIDDDEKFSDFLYERAEVPEQEPEYDTIAERELDRY